MVRATGAEDPLLGATTLVTAMHPPPLEALRQWFTEICLWRSVGNEQGNARRGGTFAFKRRGAEPFESISGR